MDFKELIWDRLTNIADLNERKQFKSIMTDVFLKLYDQNEQFHRELKARVFEEVELDNTNLDIFMGVCQRNKFDPLHPYLVPMLPSDLEEPNWDMQELITQIASEEATKLVTIFLECDYLIIQQLLSTKRIFTGKIITDGGEYELDVFLQPSATYLQEIKRLYHIFLQNDIRWRTVHHAYLAKFFDVMVKKKATVKLNDTEKVLEISVNLDEFEQYKRMHMVPLWNVKYTEVTTALFSAPVIDRVQYEHIVSLKEYGTKAPCLVACSDQAVSYVKRFGTELVIISEYEELTNVAVVQIFPPQAEQIGKENYEVITNQVKDIFLDRFARNYGNTIRSMAEIIRLINAFQLGVTFNLLDAQIVAPEQSKTTYDTYQLNEFIHDHIRQKERKQVMVLTFETTLDKQTFLIRDKLSFLVAQIQSAFPEYRCVGELQ